MKKLLIALLIAPLSSIAMAHEGYRGGYGGYHHGGGGWIAPAIIGGVIGYGLAQPHYYAPPPIYAAPPVYPSNQVYVYPMGVPVPAGMRCEIRNQIINGVYTTNNYCWY